MPPLIDLDSAREIFSLRLCPWFNLLDTIDEQKGQLRFLPGLDASLKSKLHDDYPLLYESWPQQLQAARATLDRYASDALVIPGTDISFGTPEARGKLLIQFLDELDSLESMIGPHLSEEDQMAAESQISALGSDVSGLLGPFLERLPRLIMTMFHEYLCIPVHGVPLSTLIQRAKSGDDEAYCKAVQIDGRIMAVIPYFSDRYARALRENDESFKRLFANRMKTPAYKGRIPRKSIWLTVGFLDLFGLLDTLSGEQLLDFCNEVGANDGETPIEDVKNMLKRVADYRRYQKNDPMSTP